jgi:hypothetical protein
MKSSWLVLGAVICSQLTIRTSAADLAVVVVDKEPPKAISDPIRKLLLPTAVQVIEGTAPIYQLWFASEIPLKSKPVSADKALDTIAETTLVGAVTVGNGQRDYKDNEIAAGDYTMRFGLQPQDGDHLGTADSPYFVLLIPAAGDTQLNGFASTKAMAKVSGKDTASNHPVVLNLRSASAAGGELPKLNEPAPDHKSVRVQVPAKAGADKTAIVFELVFKGHGHIQ